ncbi:MoaD/ThiS family protein [Methylomonas sp. LL1]|uniref:MoaD/ThiS family protein n=1 Tax=Methylomonas sp. LL1 TaxID=2785785 RepID=UPI0018C41AA6|nr:MoaD/ThiS family protein [Methylomonas sp. LL1]QPK62620.1 MoaD/ThiS family protein [Methylomonas sp. LL1]
MSIKVRYFASLKEKVGRGEDEINPASPLSVRAIWRQLNPNLSMPESVLAAVNMDYADLDAIVRDGDELAFFPPVTGG